MKLVTTTGHSQESDTKRVEYDHSHMTDLRRQRCYHKTHQKYEADTYKVKSIYNVESLLPRLM